MFANESEPLVGHCVADEMNFISFLQQIQCGLRNAHTRLNPAENDLTIKRENKSNRLLYFVDVQYIWVVVIVINILIQSQKNLLSLPSSPSNELISGTVLPKASGYNLRNTKYLRCFQHQTTSLKNRWKFINHVTKLLLKVT